MKNIAIVVGDITKTGGTERATANLANALISLNNLITIISINGQNIEKCYYPLDVDIKYIFLDLPVIDPRYFKKIGWYYSFIKLLRKTIHHYSFDILIGTGHAINSLLPFAKSHKKLKLIACEHIAYDSIPISSKIIRRILYRYVDCVVVLTKHSEISFNYVNKVKRIPNSLSFISEHISDLNEKQILAVGRLSKVKGFDRLIKIAALLKDKHSDWKIKIIGEGELEVQLKQLCKTLDVELNVLFAPFTINIQQEYLGSSIYVLTSHSEALPMVLLEAKACGLPIVSFNYPEGPNDIVNNGLDGFLVEDGDIDTFTEKLSILIDDISLRKKMGANAKRDSLRFSVDKIKHEWDTLINELV